MNVATRNLIGLWIASALCCAALCAIDGYQCLTH